MSGGARSRRWDRLRWRRLGWAATLVVVMWVGVRGAWAGPRSVEHVARGGETAESLATVFYGDRGMAVFIREVNGLPAGASLKAGRAVSIPTAMEVRLKSGDTLEGLAKRYLDDGRRARQLGEWNGLRVGETLQIGQRLVVPFHLVYRARAPEALSAIAKTFYGDAGQGQMLKEYNFRSSPVLAKGERVIVPVPHVRVRVAALLSRAKKRGGDAGREEAAVVAGPAEAAMPLAAAAAAQDGRVAMPATEEAPAVPAPGSAAERLRLADRAFRDGAYEDAERLLSRLVEEVASGPLRMAALRLLGFVNATLGDEAEAIRLFREVLAMDAALSLDPQLVSPKLREVFERARGGR